LDKGGPVTNFRFEDLNELLQRPDVPINYLVEGLLVRGTVSCLAAKPKVGKSTMARRLAFAVAAGTDFLGRTVEQGNVLYLALEERMEDIVADFRAMGAEGTEPIRIHASTAPQDAILALADLVRTERPALVVGDPLFRMLRVRDEKAYAEVYAALGPLIDAARDSGTHILLTHHAGKAARSDAIDSPLGSTAIGGAVSTLIYLRRTDAHRLIQTVQRVGTDMPETVLSFDPDTRNISLGSTKYESDSLKIEQEIARFLHAGQEKTEEEILAGVEGRTQNLRLALRNLVVRGEVLRHGAGKKNDAFRYSISRSESAAETRERESRISPQTRTNAVQMLVPNGQTEEILVPERGVNSDGGPACQPASRLGDACGVASGAETVFLL